jgi:hypothetical protein
VYVVSEIPQRMAEFLDVLSDQIQITSDIDEVDGQCLIAKRIGFARSRQAATYLCLQWSPND